MSISPFETLTAAMQRARNRPPNTIALVLALEGARYYVFFSQPNLGQYLNRLATKKINVAMEIAHHANLQMLADDQPLQPSAIKAAVRAAGRKGIQLSNGNRRERAADLTDRYLLREAQARNIVQIAGHAEAFFITAWRDCVADFFANRGRAPRQGEIFLTHTPCRNCDAHASPAMLINGMQYPRSCRAKLYTFFKQNNSVRWKVWYAFRFGTAEALDDAQLAQDFPGIAIGRMPEYILPMLV